MDKTKILAFAALVAILSACGSDDGGGPPELKPNYLGIISPFDTLVVKFDTKLVDLDTSFESNVVLGNGKKWVKKQTSGKELYFIGANTTENTTYGGLPYFDGGEPDSIVFKNIKNSDGYKKDITVAHFSTHPILDREPNNTQDLAGDIESLQGTITKGITFAGVIDKNTGMGVDGYLKEDKEDFYKLNLKRDDIISITVSNKTTPLKVRFFGACYSINKSTCNDKTDSTTAKNKYSVTLIDTVKTGHILEGDINQVSQFYIDIFESTNDKPNPYIVTVKKL